MQKVESRKHGKSKVESQKPIKLKAGCENDVKNALNKQNIKYVDKRCKYVVLVYS